MTARSGRIPVAKLTTQLSRGDLLHIDGLGAFAVIRPEPYGTQALIKLTWENLAVIAPATSPGPSPARTTRSGCTAISPATTATAPGSSSATTTSAI
jgi:hypothetical protein